jgi:hypothetical protein
MSKKERLQLRACNLTSLSPCLTGPVDYLLASRHKGPRFKSPGGYLCDTGILLLVMSCYIGDPNVIDHHGLSEAGFVPKPSLGPHADNVIIPLVLTQLSCPGFTLAAGLHSGFTTDGVGCWGGALWRACNLTSFSPCLTGPVDYLLASRHKGPRFKSPGKYLCETGILLLAMSRYNPLLPAEPRLYKNQFAVAGPTGPLASLHSFTIPCVLRSKPAGRGTGTICPFMLCPRLFDPRTFYPGVLHPRTFHP